MSFGIYLTVGFFYKVKVLNRHIFIKPFLMNIILVKHCEKQKKNCLLIVGYVHFGRKKLPVFSGG
jgi:hypothetical protein